MKKLIMVVLTLFILSISKNSIANDVHTGALIGGITGLFIGAIIADSQHQKPTYHSNPPVVIYNDHYYSDRYRHDRYYSDRYRHDRYYSDRYRPEYRQRMIDRNVRNNRRLYDNRYHYYR